MFLAVTLVACVLVVGAAPASATTPPDPVVVPPVAESLCNDDTWGVAGPCMETFGGSVMHDVTAHLIFWLPAGYSFAPGVTNGDALHMQLLERLFDDLNGSQTYNIVTQYHDDAYHPNRIQVDSYLDTRALPHALPLSDTDIEAEVTQAATAAGWSPRTADFKRNIYFVFTPVGVQTCLAPPNQSLCSGTQFAGYHGWYGLPLEGSTSDCTSIELAQCTVPAYAYIPTLGAGADPHYPNNAFVDPVLDTAWHELTETVTEPFGTGWQSAVTNPNVQDLEIADVCSPLFMPDRYGPRADDGSNVDLNGNAYLLQRVYSNAAQGCTLGFHGQFINFRALAARTTASPPFSLTADATSTLPVTYDAAGPCSVTGAQVTVTGVGSCTITASQAGDRPEDGFYQPATPVVRTFAITDGLPPTAAPSVEPAPNAAGWNRTAPVTVTWSWTDADSALAAGCPATTEVSTEGTTTADAACADVVGNHGTVQQEIKIDTIAPAVSITGVTDGATYYSETTPAAGCATTDGGGSGVATEAAPTTTGGPTSFTVTCEGAVDVAGNPQAAPVTASYTINHTFRITTSSLPDATRGVPYSTTLVAADGIAPYDWSMLVGDLPGALKLDRTTGVISGTPKQRGTFTFTVQARYRTRIGWGPAVWHTATRELAITVG
jgi:hypothetical protein